MNSSIFLIESSGSFCLITDYIHVYKSTIKYNHIVESTHFIIIIILVV